MASVVKPSRRIVGAVKESLLRRESLRVRHSNYYLQEDVFTRGKRLPVPRQSVQVTRPTLMAFADDAPLFNWAHSCRYLLHDAETGELYQEIPARFPPYAAERDTPRTFRAFHQSIATAVARPYRIRPDLVLRPRFAGTRYAVLFSGMSNNRHTNDLEFLYRTLRDVYQVPAGNIYVLNHNGTVNYDGDPHPVANWPGDNTPYRMPVHGKGSKADLLGVLNELKKKLQPQDSLLIHTNNHGGHNGTESDLCCFPNWDSLGVKAFTDKLAELPKYNCLMVMMEQCHSGGFNQSVISKSTADHTSIASACEEPNNSIGGAEFDPFARDWIAAMTGADPYGHALDHNPDVNGSGRVSATEAFDYANSIHHPDDTPVFHSASGGSSCTLGRDSLFRLPPLQLELIIRKFWPEPDPLLRERRLGAVLPQIEKLNGEFEPRAQSLQQEYEKRLTEIIKGAGRIR